MEWSLPIRTFRLGMLRLARPVYLNTSPFYFNWLNFGTVNYWLSLRILQTNFENIGHVEKAYLEIRGQISLILKTIKRIIRKGF